VFAAPLQTRETLGVAVSSTASRVPGQEEVDCDDVFSDLASLLLK
jgi:hypothetical protein